MAGKCASGCQCHDKHPDEEWQTKGRATGHKVFKGSYCGLGGLLGDVESGVSGHRSRSVTVSPSFCRFLREGLLPEDQGALREDGLPMGSAVPKGGARKLTS